MNEIDHSACANLGIVVKGWGGGGTKNSLDKLFL